MEETFNKIYIIGPVGSGKSTLARKMAEKYAIKMYELDQVVWNDKGENENIKRTDEEIQKIFNEILSQKSWIIEDVGRKKFINGVKEADIVYYINLSSFTIYRRCISRWIKQKIRKEQYNYKPTFKGLIQMIGWAKSGIKCKGDKINYIKENCKKYKVIDLDDINNMTI